MDQNGSLWPGGECLHKPLKEFQNSAMDEFESSFRKQKTARRDAGPFLLSQVFKGALG